MGKTFQSGHSFPTSAGFSSSSGKVAAIKPYTRAVGKRTPKLSASRSIPGVPVLSAAPKGKFARATPPLPGVPKHKPHLRAPSVNSGSMFQSGASRKISQQDVQAGSAAPLLPGFSRGGRVEKC